MSTTEKLDANKFPLAEIFTPNKFYIIPPFQRRFVWDRENFQQLMEDLWEAFERYLECLEENKKKFQDEENLRESCLEDAYYFLGSIVLSEKSRNTYYVVDGQQRLITISLLYSVLRNLIPTLSKELNDFIYSPPVKSLRRPEDFRIKYELEDERPEINDYKNIIRGKIEKTENLYRNFREALEVFENWLKSKSLKELEEFVTFLNLSTYLVTIATKDIGTAINIFNIINSRGTPLTNADLIKSEIYGNIKDKAEQEAFVKVWEKLETEFSEERYGQSEFDAILGFIRSYYNPQKPKEALYKEYRTLIEKGFIKTQEFKKLLLEISEIYEGLIKRMHFLDDNEKFPSLDSNEKVKLKNLIIILREFYPSTEWMSAVVWFYKEKRANNFVNFIKALERRLYLDWLVAKSPTERLKPIYETLQALRNNETVNSIIEKLNKGIPNKESIEYFLDDENFYGRFRGRLAKYTLLRIAYADEIRNILENISNITIEHILPQKPSNEWLQIFGDKYEAYVNKLGNLTLLRGSLNSKMKNFPFERKKGILKEEKGREFPILNEVFLDYNQWTIKELEDRHNKLKQKILEIYEIV